MNDLRGIPRRSSGLPGMRRIVRRGFGTDPVTPGRWHKSRSVIAVTERHRPPSAICRRRLLRALEISVVLGADGRPERAHRGKPGTGYQPRPGRPLSREGALAAGPARKGDMCPAPRLSLCRQRGPSVAVRETADGVHRPPQLCTPTVVTVQTDRPCSTDARPLYVRGQRNMTVCSATR
jgi:hypothetical protein